MNEGQKIIKYLAIAFAVLLIVGIVSGAVGLISALVGAFDGNDYIPTELKYTEGFDINAVKKLDIDLGGTSLRVEEGEFGVKTNNKNLSFKLRGDTLEIKEKNSVHIFGINSAEYEMVLTVPQGTVFDEIEIDAGAGEMVFYEINASRMEFDMGAGRVSISSLSITEHMDVDGGAGMFTVESGKVNRLDFDMGVGKVTMTLELCGNSSIDGGVGAVELTLVGDKSDYSVKATKGLGEITVDGDPVANNSTVGNGENVVKISGGVGSIDIEFSKTDKN